MYCNPCKSVILYLSLSLSSIARARTDNSVARITSLFRNCSNLFDSLSQVRGHDLCFTQFYDGHRFHSFFSFILAHFLTQDIANLTGTIESLKLERNLPNYEAAKRSGRRGHPAGSPPIGYSPAPFSPYRNNNGGNKRGRGPPSPRMSTARR